MMKNIRGTSGMERRTGGRGAAFVALILFLVSQLVASNTFANSHEYIAEKYLGKYDALESNGYTVESGIGNYVPKAVPKATVFAVCRPFHKERRFDCVFVITHILGQDESGHAIRATPSEMIHILLPKGWKYFDTGDTECKSSQYPGSDIIAIGKWKWRDKPLLGGYAHSLKKAWRIDYQHLRFIEVPPRDVSCGFDDDRD